MFKTETKFHDNVHLHRLNLCFFLHLTVSEIYPSQGHYSKLKGQIKVTPWHCTTTPPNQYAYQVSTSYTVHAVSDVQFEQNFKGQGHCSKVTAWHCTPTPSTNIPTKYQLSTPYGFPDKLFPWRLSTHLDTMGEIIPQQSLRAVE